MRGRYGVEGERDRRRPRTTTPPAQVSSLADASRASSPELGQLHGPAKTITRGRVVAGYSYDAMGQQPTEDHLRFDERVGRAREAAARQALDVEKYPDCASRRTQTERSVSCKKGRVPMRRRRPEEAGTERCACVLERDEGLGATYVELHRERERADVVRARLLVRSAVNRCDADVLRGDASPVLRRTARSAVCRRRRADDVKLSAAVDLSCPFMLKSDDSRRRTAPHQQARASRELPLVEPPREREPRRVALDLRRFARRGDASSGRRGKKKNERGKQTAKTQERGTATESYITSRPASGATSRDSYSPWIGGSGLSGVRSSSSRWNRFASAGSRNSDWSTKSALT